jgi:hypothetical protein
LSAYSKSGQTSTAQPAQPLKILALAPVVAPISWLTEKVAVKFVQGANKDTDISVTLQEMMQQMLQRGVKGVDKCSCKEDLTALMRAEKFVFDSKLFKSVPAISDRLLDSAAPATAPGSGSIVWHEVLVSWKNTLGSVVANSENWMLQRKAKEVLSLQYAQLRCALQEANVPGVDKASNKDDLIRIMCKFNCVYTSESLPVISLGSKLAPSTAPSDQEILEHVRQMPSPSSKAAAKRKPAPRAHVPCVISSDSNDDASISKGFNPAAVAAASKRKVVYAPLCCTGTPKNHSLCACAFCELPPLPPCKKPTAVRQPCTDSTCCTCDGSLTCDYCKQFQI